MKKILTLIAVLFLVIGANAQSKFIKITNFDTGDSLVISEARIFKGTALTDSTCLVEYLGFGAEKKSVVSNVSLDSIFSRLFRLLDPPNNTLVPVTVYKHGEDTYPVVEKGTKVLLGRNS